MSIINSQARGLTQDPIGTLNLIGHFEFQVGAMQSRPHSICSTRRVVPISLSRHRPSPIPPRPLSTTTPPTALGVRSRRTTMQVGAGFGFLWFTIYPPAFFKSQIDKSSAPNPGFIPSVDPIAPTLSIKVLPRGSQFSGFICLRCDLRRFVYSRRLGRSRLRKNYMQLPLFSTWNLINIVVCLLIMFMFMSVIVTQYCRYCL